MLILCVLFVWCLQVLYLVVWIVYCYVVCVLVCVFEWCDDFDDWLWLYCLFVGYFEYDLYVGCFVQWYFGDEQEWIVVVV